MNASDRSPRVTLSIGGAGIVLATIVPLVAIAVFIFPVPVGLAWLNSSWQSLYGTVSALVLLLAMVVLALGVPGEPGIAGRSVAGRVALIVFGAASLIDALSSGSLPSAGTSAIVLTLIQVGLTTVWVVEIAALVVASVFVLRAGVLQGVARWALIALAMVTVVSFVLWRLPSTLTADLALWSNVVVLLVQLAVGVLFFVRGRTSARRAVLSPIAP